MVWRKTVAMADDAVVRLLARDLVANLEERAPGLANVYGVALWCDPFTGDFLAGVATEDWYEGQLRLPAYAGKDEADVRRLDGVRWSVGDWHRFPDDDFLSAEAQAAIAPLAPDNLGTDDERALEAACERLCDIAYETLRLARPLDHVPTTDDAIAFCSFADSTTAENGLAMLETVPPSTFHRLFPEWRAPAE